MPEQPPQRGAPVVSEVRDLHSPDLDPLATSQPPDPTHFALLIEVTVGSKGEPGGDYFGIVVCTPSWLASRIPPEGHLFARHHLIVQRYDFALIRDAIRKRMGGVQGVDWAEVSQVLSRWGHWEYEDYQLSNGD